MSIYVVNGAPGAGKTTFERNVSELVGDRYCYILSTITPVKDIAKTVGWNGEKDLKSRKFLSDLKDLLTEYNNYPMAYICNKIKEIQDAWGEYGVSLDSLVIFIDCREPEEIKKLCDGLGAKSLIIRRASAENSETSNHADEQVLNYNYDIVIENDGDIRDFAIKAFKFVVDEQIDFQPGFTINLMGEIVRKI